MLGIFKYSDFVIETVNAIVKTNITPLSLVLPLGISFYTFQALSYVLDVYLDRCKYQPNFVKFAMYIALFPQLIAGPIVRYTDIEEQISDRSAKPDEIVIGIRRFVLGLGKKVLLANTAGALFETLSEYGSEMTALAAILAALAYTFQIYFDFSGYSDMAIGLGCIFGFYFPENFNYPYEATSITDFWRRWHMTLSSFFREYVYFPLGGSKRGLPRQIFNLLVVWTLTGIWHGAAWSFLLWGAYFAVLLIIEKLALKKIIARAPRFLLSLYSLFFIFLGWLIFASDGITLTAEQGLSVLGRLFFVGTPSFAEKQELIVFSGAIPFALILIFGSTPMPRRIYYRICRRVTALSAILPFAAFIVSVAYIVSSGYNPFLYFRF